MKPTREKSVRSQLIIASFAALGLFAAQPKLAATDFSWGSATTGGTWTTAGNWTPTTGYPGFNGTAATTTDTATLGNATAARDVTLNANETIASLFYNQTSAFTNELEIFGSGTTAAGTPTTLTVTNALTIGGNTTGTELLYVNGTAAGTGTTNSGLATYKGAINIGANGVLELGSYNNASAAAVTGAVTVGSGGTLNVDRYVLAGASTGTAITGNLTVNSGGTLNLATANSSGLTPAASDTRLGLTGNLLVAGGTVAGSTATTNEIYIGNGSSAVTAEFDTGSSVSNLTQIVYNSGGTGTAFTLKSDVSLSGTVIYLRPTVTTAGAAFNANVGAVTGGNTLTVGSLQTTLGVGSTATPGTTGFTLTSNVTTALTTATAFNLTGTAVTNENTILNTGGFVFNASASSGFTNPTTAINVLIEGGGTIMAKSFSFSGNTGTSGTTVTGAVLMQANGGTGTVNNLGNAYGGAIDATSTFQYVGTSTAAAPATLTSNHVIGALTVGTGSSASNLQLSTATLAVANNVTVNTGGTLQLGGQMLSLTTGANLTGTGTISGTTGGAVSGGTVAFAGGATGGIIPGTNGTVGALTLTGTQAFTLASTSMSLFDIAAAAEASNDHLTFGTTGTVTLTYAGSLTLNFLGGYTPTSGSTIQIADANAAALGTFSNITSNLAGDSFTFNSATGFLTVTAVPEPSTVAGMSVLLAMLGWAGYKRGQRVRTALGS